MEGDNLILVVDSDLGFCAALEESMQARQCKTVTALNMESAMQAVFFTPAGPDPPGNHFAARRCVSTTSVAERKSGVARHSSFRAGRVSRKPLNQGLAAR